MAGRLGTLGNSELLAKASVYIMMISSHVRYKHNNTHMTPLSDQISRAAFKESVGVYQRKHFHLCCVFFCPHMCVYTLFLLC